MRKKGLHRATIGDYVISAILIGLAVCVLMPFINAVVISFVSETEYVRNRLTFFPKEPTLSAYRKIIAQGWLDIGYKNSLVIVLLGWAYVLCITVLTSYVMTCRFPGKRLFLAYLVIPMFFSGGLIPMYLQIRDLNLMDTFGAIVLPAGVSTYYMLIMSSFFRSIPSSLLESARLDGASEARVLWSVILPLSKSILATISLFVVVAFWNEWFAPMLYIQNPKLLPLQLYLRNVVDASQASADRGVSAQQVQTYAEGVRMAGVMLTMLPIMLIYPFLQKYFVRGVMIGAVKG